MPALSLLTLVLAELEVLFLQCTHILLCLLLQLVALLDKTLIKEATSFELLPLPCHFFSGKNPV